MIRTDWSDFVTGFSRIEKNWEDFVKKKYLTVEKLNEAYGTNYESFNQSVPVQDVSKIPEAERAGNPWYQDTLAVQKIVEENRKHEVPAEALHLNVFANLYRDWIREKYHGDLAALNEAYGCGYKSLDEMQVPELPPGE